MIKAGGFGSCYSLGMQECVAMASAKSVSKNLKYEGLTVIFLLFVQR